MRSAIAQHLLEVVGDVDDADAPVGEPADERQEMLGLGLPQRRGRLVEDEDIGREAQCPHDHRQLALGRGEPGPELVGVEVDAQVVDERLRDAALLTRVHDIDAAQRLLAQEDVVGHAQAGHDVRLLVDGADSELQGRARSQLAVRLAVQDDGALVRLHDAGQDLHERGLARPVLADEAVDLARSQVEADVHQGARARIRLEDVLQRKDRTGMPSRLGLRSGPLGLRDHRQASFTLFAARQQVRQVLLGDVPVDVARAPRARPASGLTTFSGVTGMTGSMICWFVASLQPWTKLLRAW